MERILIIFFFCCFVAYTLSTNARDVNALDATTYGINVIDASAIKKSETEQAKERKILRVAFSAFIPRAMPDSTGDFIGFEIDVAKRLAQDMNLMLQFKPTSWASMIPDLNEGKFDVIISGMEATDEILQQVDLTVPYDYSVAQVLVSNKYQGQVESLADLDKEGMVIAVRSEAKLLPIIRLSLENAELREYHKRFPIVDEFLAGEIDALITRSTFYPCLVQKYPDEVFVAFEFLEHNRPIGFAVRKNDVETLNTFNTWIEKVEADGWLKERADYWFKTKNWQSLL